MYLSLVEIILPLLLVVLITLPLIKVFKGEVSAKICKK